MDERYRRLKELIGHAMELAPDRRAAYLEEACGGDESLLTDVRELLESGTRDDGFLEPPGQELGSAAEAPIQIEEGERVGDFRILRAIATGGMGTVFEAEQDEPRRRVALKMLQSGFASEDSLRRFRREIEVLGALRHPAIAQIYATGVHAESTAGIAREHPWFAMELVEGGAPVTSHARTEKLGLDDRLRLFNSICDAVEHGHAQGVVHRDLKPDNILVGSDGRPKVIDFGVARATGADIGQTLASTRDDMVVGTLPYMSPEQIGGGELGPASDVYSLGVLLYELVSGELPLDLAGLSLPRAARALAEAPPRTFGEVGAAVPGDLETIVRKALEKEPRRRYASADELASDVGRFLRNEPIIARPPSTRYRAAMFARRHRVPVAAAAVVVAVSSVAWVANSVQARRAEDRQAAADELDARRLRVFRFLTGVDAPKNSSPLSGIRSHLPDVELTRELLQGVVDNFEAESAREDLGAGDRIELARACSLLGDALGNPAFPNLGDVQGARDCYQRAREIVTPLADENLEARRTVANVLGKAGQMAIASRDFEAARLDLEESLAIYETLAQQDPTYPLARQNVAHAVARMGDLHDNLGERVEQESCARRSIEIFKQVCGDAPEDPIAYLDLVRSYLELADWQLETGQVDEALAEYERAIETLEVLVDFDPGFLGYRSTLNRARYWGAQAARTSGQVGRAEEWAALAVAGYRELVELDPNNVQLPPLLASAESLLELVVPAAD